MTSRLTLQQRTELAKNLKIRAVTGKGLTKEKRAQLRESAANLEALNQYEAKQKATAE